MRDFAHRRWSTWRVTRVEWAAGTPVATQCAPRRGELHGRHEQPGPDGIRHELVARIRREIEAGTYDSEERWLQAEELLIRRVVGGM